ncbi:hypothetical protein [Clostridium sp. BJN0001]|uniref:hypothetical protein n=1 Tax=Clostridium sp. BJN0001 TaxID=2930219 RepID=UPI001FD14032|nr:hypothetical protein [Clostridium sp. BJN0001]
MANQICKDTGCCQANCSSPLFKDNSQPDCCTVTSPVTCSSAADAVCASIITEKIVNCMTFEKTESSFSTPVTFVIDPPPDGVTYTAGDAICITKIGISYSTIGIAFANKPTIYANGSLITVDPVLPAFNCNSLNLFKEFSGTLSTDRCCYGDDDLNGVSYRFIQSQIKFHICALKVFVKGKIGCEDFTASYSPANNPILASDLGINDFTFSGSVCLPRDTTLTIYDRFNPCLDIFSVITDASYTTDDEFSASLELGLKIDKKMLFTDIENLTVFVPESYQLNCTEGTGNVPECPNDDCNI